VISDADEWDGFVHRCIKLFVDNGDLIQAEKFITLIHKDEHRIDSFILCGKLKSAYLLAVQYGKKDKVVHIL
jgi:hypothetical protein